MRTAPEFSKAKAAGRKVSIVTAYDAWSARMVAASRVDAILVGDSVAMVVHGHATTLAATVDMIALHTAAVARAASGKFIVADLPFLSYRKGLPAAMDAVEALVRAGAHAVKLEGVDGHEDVIARIVGSGVPVMGHIGLMPQHVHEVGGYRVQGRTDDATDRLVGEARTLERLGCFAIVIECVRAHTAERITEAISIPTIGIGAGPGTDGQVLVLHDLLGLEDRVLPKFVRRYASLKADAVDAVARYAADVRAGRFPAAEESYHLSDEVSEALGLYGAPASRTA
jgi:3-methyl-2-oxobutanoate hydroxymethyltransferase